MNGTTTTFFLNGTQILAQKKGDSDISWFFYDSTGTRVGLIRGSYVFYYVYNLQDDVVGLMNAATGKIVAKYSYDAWGNCTVTNASGWTVGNNNPFRYRGYYFDTETNLYYLNSRYYDPAMGRFINADVFASTGQGFVGNNMFAYCGNNPSNGVDPRGEKDRSEDGEEEETKSFWSLNSDWAGREILFHWLFGGGEAIIAEGGKWGQYMSENELLNTQIQTIVDGYAQSIQSGEGLYVEIQTHIDIENGEDIIGYQYLHGSNADVGDFQLKLLGRW